MMLTPALIVRLASLIVLVVALVLLLRGELLWGLVMLAIAAMGFSAGQRPRRGVARR
jgi:hypothetical protein